MPALAVTSSSCGIWRFLHWMDFAEGGGAGPWATPWPNSLSDKVRTKKRVRQAQTKDDKSIGTPVLLLFKNSLSALILKCMEIKIAGAAQEWEIRFGSVHGSFEHSLFTAQDKHESRWRGTCPEACASGGALGYNERVRLEGSVGRRAG